MSKQLPEYMLPSSYIFLEKLPLNANGKLDRKSLPKPEQHYYRGEEDQYVAARTATEKQLVEIWSQLLGIEKVGIYDNFFKLGGNSIIAAQIIVKSIGINIRFTLKQLFDNPTIAKLCQIFEENKSQELTITSDLLTPKLLPPETEPYPLTSMQTIMIENYGNKGTEIGVYHSQLSYLLEDVNFSINAFKKALLIINQHPTFRVSIIKDDNGYKQFICPNISFHIYEKNLENLSAQEQRQYLEKIMLEDRLVPFNFNDQNENLFRLKLFLLNKNQVEFFISLHHAIEDGWGVIEFLKSLFETYHKLKNKVTIDIKNIDNIHRFYVNYEQKIMNSIAEEEFWKSYLNNATISKLTPIVPESANTPPNLTIKIGNDLISKIKKLAEELNVSLKSLFLSAYTDIIFELILDKKFIIGVVSNGGRIPEISGSLEAFGLFWNMLPIVMNFSSDKINQIKLTHENLLKIDTHASYPLKKIIQDIEQQDIFFSTFNFVNFHNLKDIFSNIKILSVNGYDKFHYPLNLAVSIEPEDNSIEIRIDYDKKYFAHQKIQYLLKRYVEQLFNIANHSKKDIKFTGLFWRDEFEKQDNNETSSNDPALKT